MSTNSDKIKAKIKALLSKTVENGATEEEMNTAFEKANELMLLFFISKEDLEESLADEKCIVKTIPLAKTGYKVNHFYGMLAQLFDCKVFWNDGLQTITFYGYKHDTDLCVYFYHMIMRSCMTSLATYKKSYDYSYYVDSGFRHGRTLTFSFVKGWIQAVTEKMYNMWKARMQHHSDSTALVCLKSSKVQEQYDQQNFKTRHVNTHLTKASGKAFASGYNSGEQFELVHAVDSNTEIIQELE